MVLQSILVPFVSKVGKVTPNCSNFYQQILDRKGMKCTVVGGWIFLFIIFQTGNFNAHYSTSGMKILDIFVCGKKRPKIGQGLGFDFRDNQWLYVGHLLYGPSSLPSSNHRIAIVFVNDCKCEGKPNSLSTPPFAHMHTFGHTFGHFVACIFGKKWDISEIWWK